MTVSFDFSGLDKIARGFHRSASLIGRYEAAAVRRAGTSARSVLVKKIHAHLNIPQREIRQRLTVRGRPTAHDTRYVIEVKRAGIPLIHFAARETRRGVTVKVFRDGPRKLITHGPTFIARGAGGGARHVWERETKLPKRLTRAGRYAGTGIKRRPISILYGPDVLSQFVQEAIQRAGDKRWEERLPIELERATNRALELAGYR